MSMVGQVVLTVTMEMLFKKLISVTMEMLFKKLISEVLPLFGRQEKIRSDLEDWQRKLKKIKAVLDDAEDKQMTNESVKIWLCDLQNLAYDVEDILDEFATEALKRRLLNQFDQPSTSNFRKLIPTCCTNFSPSSIKFDYKMTSKIEDITRRLQKIATEKNLFELNENSAGRSRNVDERLPTTSLVNEAKVFGREKEKEEIIELLLRDDLITDDGFSVIPIVGIGGMGKTTLAQLVYNDKNVEAYFDFKIWVCVSEDFNVIKVTKTILSSIGDQAGDGGDLNKLQENLKGKLLQKKFFLILDDVWEDNRDKWDLLSRPFGAGSPKSKVVVTTRTKVVASIVGNVDTVTPYELNKLSDDDCLSLFTQHSLGTRDFNMHQRLKKIGENIVKKCDGLPLAAKALGSLLRHNYNRDDWLQVQNSKIWELPEEKCGIMKALRLSYRYLPAHLKLCFAYCSLLPKDYEFHEQEVVLLWMAEGLLQPDSNEKKTEEFGHDYFQELQSRSFFQQSSIDTSKFIMHDLIIDLAQWAAGEVRFRKEDTPEGSLQPKDSKKLRHLSYIAGLYDGPKRFESIFAIEHLRTFLPMKVKLYRHNLLSYNVVDELFKQQHLRVLSLRKYYLLKIHTIQKLIHLRYLDLSGTPIVTLPESVSTLYNLHVLQLENCYQLKTLCTDMGNLLKLRHLNNSNTDSLEKMPLGISKLTCLQTLHHFVVGKNVDSQLQELNSLENLRGKLKISRLENLKDVGIPTRVELNGKKNLHELFLEWSNNSGRSLDPEAETQVLDMLRPHENLKQLTIKGYNGTRFPTWLGDYTFSNFVHLSFQGCYICTCLPTIGQLPVLKHLSIVGMVGVKRVGLEFYGDSGSVSFPSLETLRFENLKEWEDWIPPYQDVELFPQLRELSLVNCSKLLGRLPERFPLLERLVIQECERLLVSIPSIPTLCKLEINGCRKVVCEITLDPSSSMVSSDTSEQVFQTRLLKHKLPNLKELTIKNTKEATSLWQNGTGLLQDISSLHQLKISSYHQFFSLLAEEEDMQEQPRVQCKLHSLALSDCQSLVKLPAQALLSLVSLKKIVISDCDYLESLPEAWMHNNNISLESLNISCCNSLTCITSVRLPLSLKQMVIRDCKNLRTLIDEDQEGSSIKLEQDINSWCRRYTSALEQLVIKACPSLISLLSKSELPATLERIEVQNCSKLAFLSSRGNLPNSLKDLTIYNCSELESIAEGLDNNTSLENIFFIKCQNLRLLPNNLCKAHHLQRLSLYDCPKLVSFPEGGLQACTKLTQFGIIGCEKLKTLPNGMRSLTSLQELRISNCPSIDLCFPEDEASFPTNILSLGICYMKIYKPLYERRLHRFTSITELTLNGEFSDPLVSFPLEENAKGALPTSLRRLWITNFRNLERLHSIFENLTSLESLWLQNCPKLEYFPENILPSSLLEFKIYNCGLLVPKFMESKGQYWPLITHVPYVYVFSYNPRIQRSN